MKRLFNRNVHWKKALLGLLGALWGGMSLPVAATPPRIDRTVECELLIVGGGIAGVAAATEALLRGRTVCLTEITDWVGGQISAQGTSALDEAQKQRSLLVYSKGYKELRRSIEQHYGKLNPGDCWVSVACFLPKDGHQFLWNFLENSAKKGRGKLHWFPSTVIKELNKNPQGNLITAAVAIQHKPAPGTAPLNTETLSSTIEEAYNYASSSRFNKSIIRFIPKPQKTPQEKTPQVAPWYIIEATETGEIIALADVPYQLGLDPRSHRNPSSPVTEADPYCTQGFTYTFAMEQTAEEQPQIKPPYYEQYRPYYGYDPDPKKAGFNFVFTYRRLWSPNAENRPKYTRVNKAMPAPGDISMQNWVWGNDYRPGTAKDNLIYTRNQLLQRGELSPGGWQGGLRVDALRKGEELARGFYYWLVADTSDSQLGDGVKKLHLNHRYLEGLNSPMGTEHGLSKYPYIREARRIIGRPSLGYEEGFTMDEIDISRQDFRKEYYQTTLSPKMYRDLWVALAGLETINAITGKIPLENISRRTRSTLYPDSIGISQYAIDFHPCLTLSPPETPGNTERAGVRQAHGQAYPGQIPLRSLIPQQIDNLLIAGKSIAMSNIVAAAYRVHSFEWSVGAAAGTTAIFALENEIFPYQLVEKMPRSNPLLRQLQIRLQENGNPIAFPNSSIFNLDWESWRVW